MTAQAAQDSAALRRGKVESVNDDGTISVRYRGNTIVLGASDADVSPGSFVTVALTEGQLEVAGASAYGA